MEAIGNINKNCGIYKITSPTGRVYIGQSKNIKERFLGYKNMYGSNSGQVRLHNSLQKYGWGNHQFDIIEYCSVEELNCSERFWQDEFDVLNGGLNCKLTNCGEKRVFYSEEVRKKMSTSQKGKKASEETKQRMRDSAIRGDKHHNYKRTPTEEHKKSIAEANTGNSYRLGKKASEETKQKIREAFSKLVLCLETGIYYDSAKEASKVCGIGYEWFCKQLGGKGKIKNNTNYIYV